MEKATVKETDNLLQPSPSLAGGKRRPVRTCVGCRQRRDQSSFLRLSNDPARGVVLVASGVARGRGAYFCPEVNCVEAGLAKGRLARALKTAISAERLEAIKKELICKLQ